MRNVKATQNKVDNRIVSGCEVRIKNPMEQRFLERVHATVENVNRDTGYVTIYTKKILYVPTYDLPADAVEYLGYLGVGRD